MPRKAPSTSLDTSPPYYVRISVFRLDSRRVEEIQGPYYLLLEHLQLVPVQALDVYHLKISTTHCLWLYGCGRVGQCPKGAFSGLSRTYFRYGATSEFQLSPTNERR